AVRPRVRPAARHADVLPQRAPVLPGPDLQRGARRARPAGDDLDVRPLADRARVGARVRVRHRAHRPRRDADRRGPLMALQLTPSQTVGPYFSIGLTWDDGAFVVPDGTDGAFWLRGRVTDGE